MSSVVAGLVLVVGLASKASASVPGRARQTTVTITGKVKEIGATKAKGSCSFTGTRDGRPVSGSCTIVFTGKEQDDGAWHTTSATLTYTGTGRLHRRGDADDPLPVGSSDDGSGI